MTSFMLITYISNCKRRSVTIHKRNTRGSNDLNIQKTKQQKQNDLDIAKYRITTGQRIIPLERQRSGIAYSSLMSINTIDLLNVD